MITSKLCELDLHFEKNKRRKKNRIQATDELIQTNGSDDWVRINILLRFSAEKNNYLSVVSTLPSLLEQHPFNADVTTAKRYLPNRPYRRQTRLLLYAYIQ